MTISRTTLTANGPELSRFIAGYWRLQHWGFSDQELLQFIEQHIALGITTVDHAMVYRSEALFGRALKLKPSLRDELEIITKFGIRPAGFGALGAKTVNHYDSSRAHIIDSVESSLRDLATETVDILLVHRPDYLMEPEEVAEAFSQLKASGKVKYFGVSNFTTAQFNLLQHYVKSFAIEGLVTNQIELSPYYLDALDTGVLEQSTQLGISPMLWSCLAGGKLLNPENDKSRRLHNALTAVAKEHGLANIEPIVYAWVMALPCNPIPLLGTSKISRMQTAIAAETIQLSREQWYLIWQASKGHSVP